MQRRYCQGLSVRLSVCPSLCQTRSLWQNEINLCPHFTSHERSFMLVFWQEEWLVEATPSSWNFWPNWPCWCENANLQSIFTRSASVATPSENSSINTNRKSTYALSMILRWTSYVVPKLPEGVQKRKTTVFRLKLHFTWRKSATKFPCVNTVSDKVVRHSLAYLSVKKCFAGDVPTTWKFGLNWPTPSKTPISNQYLLVAPQP